MGWEPYSRSDDEVDRILQMLENAVPQVELMATRYLRSREDVARLTASTLSKARVVIRETVPAQFDSPRELLALLFRIQHQQVRELLLPNPSQPS